MKRSEIDRPVSMLFYCTLYAFQHPLVVSHFFIRLNQLRTNATDKAAQVLDVVRIFTRNTRRNFKFFALGIACFYISNPRSY